MHFYVTKREVYKSLELLFKGVYGRHSSIQDFLIKKFSVYSPIEPWHKMTTRV